MLSITTDTGYRLDVDPKATIEVNMGGISLLNLADRTATYTNSFKLPRTPNNESIFSFASQPTRNNRPVLNVLISKGLFQKTAVLKVLDTNNDSYNCSVSYDSIDAFLDFKNIKISALFETKELYRWSSEPSITQSINAFFNSGFQTFYPVVYGHTLQKPFVLITKLLDIINQKYGYTFSGDVIMNADFIKLCLCVPYIENTIDAASPIGNFIYMQTNNGFQSSLTIGNLLKNICYLFAADINVNSKNIEINTVDYSSLGISIEIPTLSKKIKTENGNKNFIKYSVIDETINTDAFSDFFLGDGEYEKTFLKMDIKIPKYYDTILFGYDFSGTSIDDICIMSLINGSYNVSTDGSNFEISTIPKLASPLALAGFYSSILNPIFANPVILEATRYIDPLTADSIMNTRVINSVQLGGRYWVDTIAYNLTTGQSKMTLIKLP